MIMFNFFFMVMFFLANLMFLVKRKHLLNMLLILEFLMLILFLLVILILMNINYESYFLIIFMVFMVCEGVLGITILVMLIRSFGSDYFFTYNLLKC
uniref:NADH-ubiquinone oxidoreductase chain 4L n=1 Tax=Hydropsyche simulans TaxID=763302 RepID=A0A3G1NDF2_9NEOP|nr:NADH dehydrogenase subunit 4L [Hydropsyche simulans]AUT18143.1 NADH dehydrogenase subunit 4L [Hydropsyche simulans]